MKTDLKRILIFGAGNLGKVLAKELSDSYFIIGFLDNNKDLWGKKIFGIKVLGGIEELESLEYDEIVIASTMRYAEIRNSLERAGVKEDKFNQSIQNKLLVEVQARVNFLRDFSKMKNDYYPSASVAEGGVFQGMFASEINRFFSDRKLFLFDTFEGFNKRDVDVEVAKGFSDVTEGYYYETSEDSVLSKMKFPENVVIKKGYFPETLVGMHEREQFLFVNLDFDLYNPTLEGLRYFYPRMVPGGVILIHDYFTEYYHGVKKAVDKYESEQNIMLNRIPIGDGISIAIVINGDK